MSPDRTRDVEGVDVDLEVEDASNVLALASPADDAAYFGSLLPSVGSDVVAIEYRRSPDRFLETWNRHAGALPTRCAIVSVGDYARSAATTRGDSMAFGPATVDLVADCGDLTTLGRRIGDHLEEPGTVLTFDSLSEPLADVELPTAFRFLHVLVNRVAAAEAVGYYRLDPDAHDEQTVSTLSQLFDVTVRLEDGVWTTV